MSNLFVTNLFGSGAGVEVSGSSATTVPVTCSASGRIAVPGDGAADFVLRAGERLYWPAGKQPRKVPFRVTGLALAHGGRVEFITRSGVLRDEQAAAGSVIRAEIKKMLSGTTAVYYYVITAEPDVV